MRIQCMKKPRKQTTYRDLVFNSEYHMLFRTECSWW